MHSTIFGIATLGFAIHDLKGKERTTPPITPPSEGDISGCGLTFQRGQSTVPFSVGPSARPTELEVIYLQGEDNYTESKVLYFCDGLHE